jgi:ketosteroid isomerase-like protein
MSMANVQIVQRCWEAWGRHDIDAVLALMDPDAVWDFSHYDPWEADPVVRGLVAIRALLEARMLETGPQGVQPTAFFDGGDTVLVHCWLSTEPVPGGPRQDERWASVYTLSEGRVVRAETFSDRDEARQAAGLAARRAPLRA